jgi:hypothetical protein
VIMRWVAILNQKQCKTRASSTTATIITIARASWKETLFTTTDSTYYLCRRDFA